MSEVRPPTAGLNSVGHRGTYGVNAGRHVSVGTGESTGTEPESCRPRRLPDTNEEGRSPTLMGYGKYTVSSGDGGSPVGTNGIRKCPTPERPQRPLRHTPCGNACQEGCTAPVEVGTVRLVVGPVPRQVREGARLPIPADSGGPRPHTPGQKHSVASPTLRNVARR